jgi:transcriptional regulator with XRE-family HTH domain
MVSSMDTNGADIRFIRCGGVIRELRERANISIRELEARTGCDRGWLSKIENNALAVSLSKIVTIAEGLEVPVDELILKCLESRFPQLHATEAGAIVARHLSGKRKPQ